jgi:hypothetical protein
LTPGLNVNAARCEALFASALQRSDRPTVSDVRAAVQRAVRDLGSSGCAAWVAQEFGDHPETAILRMQWARQAVDEAFNHALAADPEPAEVPVTTPVVYAVAERAA